MNHFFEAVQRINLRTPMNPRSGTPCNIPLRWWTKVKLPDPRLPSWATQQTELEATFGRKKTQGKNRTESIVRNASHSCRFSFALSLPASVAVLCSESCS